MHTINNKEKVLELLVNISNEILKNSLTSEPSFTWDNKPNIKKTSIDGISVGLHLLVDKDQCSINNKNGTVDCRLKVLEVIKVHKDNTLESCNGAAIHVTYSKEMSDLVTTVTDFEEEHMISVLDSEFSFIDLNSLKHGDKYTIINNGGKLKEEVDLKESALF